jgi:FlaA1/EpsC-like NDP-sugar epimerase
MIHLSGLEVREPEYPAGDIEIIYTGLRPGEKLYEELLIGERTTSTEHPRIFKSDEPFLPPEELDRELSILKSAILNRDATAIQDVLRRTVEGYQPSGETMIKQVGEPELWRTVSRTLH